MAPHSGTWVSRFVGSQERRCSGQASLVWSLTWTTVAAVGRAYKVGGRRSTTHAGYKERSGQLKTAERVAALARAQCGWPEKHVFAL